MSPKLIWIIQNSLNGEWRTYAHTGDRLWYLDSESPRGKEVLAGLSNVAVSMCYNGFAVEFSDQAFADLQEIRSLCYGTKNNLDHTR